MTGLTGIFDNLARATTCGACLLHGEKALLHAHLPHTLTGATGFWPGAFFGAAAVADFALFMARYSDFDGFALDRLFQVQLQRIAEVRATGVAATARSEEHTSELQSRPHLVCRL